MAEWEEIGKNVKLIAWIVAVFLFDSFSTILQCYAALESISSLQSADNGTT